MGKPNVRYLRGGGWKRVLRWNCEPTRNRKGGTGQASTYGSARQCPTRLSCFDRVVITGSLPDIGHAQAMEGCTSFRSWTDKTTGHTRLKPVQGKCLHYYFYFIDEAFGLGLGLSH